MEGTVEFHVFLGLDYTDTVSQTFGEAYERRCRQVAQRRRWFEEWLYRIDPNAKVAPDPSDLTSTPILTVTSIPSVFVKLEDSPPPHILYVELTNRPVKVMIRPATCS